MTPSKSNSVRSKGRPAPRISPFKDDSTLMGVRYEQTKQDKPPIPIGPGPNSRRPLSPGYPPPPARNPLRAYRPSSIVTSNSAPAGIFPPLVAPPHEDHPIFRIRSSQPHETRPDSAAPTMSTASTTTLKGDAEDEYLCQKIGDQIFPIRPLFTLEKDVSAVQCMMERPLIVVPKVSPSAVPSLDNLPPPPRRAPELPAIPSQAELVVVPEPEPEHEPVCASPTGTKSEKKLLGKHLSLSSSSGPPNRLRKRNISVPNIASSQPPVSPSTPSPLRSTWGSLRGPKFPRSPLTAGVVSSPQTNNGSRGCIASSFQQLDKAFMPLTTEIPSDIVLSLDLFETLEFSKRGSIMFGAKRSHTTSNPSSMQKSGDNVALPDATSASARAPAGDGASSTIPNIRILAPEVEKESQKVRSLYDSAETVDWHDGGPASTLVERPRATVEDPSRGEQNDPYGFLDFNPVRTPSFGADSQDRFRQLSSSSHRSPSEGALLPRAHIPSPQSGMPRSASSSSQLRDKHARGEFELAGGLEDWEDVSGGEVDRYGFITPKKPQLQSDSPETTPDDTRLSPTKRRGILGLRPGASYGSSPLAPQRTPTKKVSARSLNTQNTDSSAVTHRSASSVVRRAANWLPHNRERRWMDEAGDMLNLSPGLDDIQEEELTGKHAEAAKRKEWERAEKWRKMAKISKGEKGEGMDFEFDANNQKVIERTWKGIPDRWRAAAWYSFLATSARNMGGKEDETHMFSEFHRLQDVPSPDDVQIDLDVPRTINKHIMFRKRYKGGQRLLFRVLHALSLYFPDTGYVQGMASLAATLLCYFDEEKTFVMLVRMWRYRGLERLYQPGFGGLMTTLDDFQKHWLEGKDVARKLKGLEIDPTAYGTRWYLTLFNHSIPFAAQLRVWDVFMLLGECSPEPPKPSTPTSTSQSKGKAAAPPSYRGLDILHATSAAIIDALQEVLLDSDFENAMKALTSWVPIKDEEMLMKVTRAEWKQHQTSKKPWDAMRSG